MAPKKFKGIKNKFYSVIVSGLVGEFFLKKKEKKLSTII
jgi:hypothetical protein